MYHWVLENNVVRDNRMGIYLDAVNWIDMAGNVLDNREDNLLIAHDVSNLVMHADDPKITEPPRLRAGRTLAGDGGQAGCLRRRQEHGLGGQEGLLPLGP